MVQMLLDRRFRDAESLCDLSVALAQHQQIDDLPLAAGERRRRLAYDRRSLLAPVSLPTLPLAAIAQAAVRSLCGAR